jgi:hypothetical protein
MVKSCKLCATSIWGRIWFSKDIEFFKKGYLEEIQETFKLYKEIQPNLSGFWITAPYPTTELYEYCKKIIF